MSLPNGYIPCQCLTGRTNAYIDTGVVTSNTISIDALLGYGSYSSGTDGTGYAFGARNTSSTSSAGQLNLQKTSTAFNVGYGSARATKTFSKGGSFHFHNNANNINVTSSDWAFSLEASEATFTGTRNMFLFALNNAGSPSYPSANVLIYGFKIKDNGTLVRNFIPAYEESSQTFGMYESVQGTFYTSAGSAAFYDDYNVLINVEHGDGGDAYIITREAGNVKRFYNFNLGVVHCVAVPLDGYVFKNWEYNGAEIPGEEDDFIELRGSGTLKANFVKKTSDYYNAPCTMGIIKSTSHSSTQAETTSYAKVLSCSIKNDSMQKSTSTFVVDEMPEDIGTMDGVFVRNAMGKTVYYGVVESFEDKTITCREPLAIFDNDFLFHATTATNVYQSGFADATYRDYLRIMKRIALEGYSTELRSIAVKDDNLIRRNGVFYRGTNALDYLNMDFDEVQFSPLPASTDVNISNMEDKFISLMQESGMFPQYGYVAHGTTGRYLSVDFVNSYRYEPMKIGDGNEVITNVNINIEDTQTTVIHIYNSAGTTLRGMYAMDKDGGIVKFTESSSDSVYQSLLSYSKYKIKVISSDDPISSLKTQNLANAMYNHKITFVVDIKGSLLKFDDFKIGRRVEFFYKGKSYNSVITAIDFDINENSRDVTKLSITLGSVRTNLTSKLNLGKVKR